MSSEKQYRKLIEKHQKLLVQSGKKPDDIDSDELSNSTMIWFKYKLLQMENTNLAEQLEEQTNSCTRLSNYT